MFSRLGSSYNTKHEESIDGGGGMDGRINEMTHIFQSLQHLLISHHFNCGMNTTWQRAGAGDIRSLCLCAAVSLKRTKENSSSILVDSREPRRPLST